MQWYYANKGQQLGPITQPDLEKLVSEGVIKPDTLVWYHGLDAWRPYSQVATGAAVPGAEGDTAVCAVSGKTNPKRDMIQYEGRWISAEHRDEFFQRVREGAPMPGADTVPGPFGYGRFLQRFVARIVDGLIVGVTGMIIGALIGAVFGASGALQNSTGAALLMQVLIQIINLALGISYEVYFIRKQDATPGKKLLGLKLLRADGSKLSVGRIIGRYFAHILSAITLMIGYLMAAFDDQGRALHDRVCDTRVIKTK